MNRITDLIEDALQQDDYKMRINFLIVGLICEEENDTPEKLETNKKCLLEIDGFIKNYSGDAEKKEFLLGIRKSINNYLGGLK